jgi:hypothetical protein
VAKFGLPVAGWHGRGGYNRAELGSDGRTAHSAGKEPGGHA